MGCVDDEQVLEGLLVANEVSHGRSKPMHERLMVDFRPFSHSLSMLWRHFNARLQRRPVIRWQMWMALLGRFRVSLV